MKKSLIIIAAAFFGFASQALAQSENNDDEIIVTDAQGKQEVIDLPEALTHDYDSLLNNYNSKTYLHMSFDCNMPDVNPVYSAEVYKERLSRIPTIIELPYNDVVQKFIDRYSGRLRRSVSVMLGAQNFYMPIFEEALESYGLPLELKYLPVIESALNPNAICAISIKSSATGTSLSQPTTAVRRPSTAPFTAQTARKTTGASILICRKKHVATCRRLSPPTI